MDNNTKQTTTLSKQKKLIIILSCAAAVVAAGYLAISLFVKDPLYTVKKYDEDGDAVFAAITDGTGEVTKASIEKELAIGKGEHDVRKGETDDVLYTFRARNVTVSYRPFIVPEIPLENLFSVKVENASGTFTVKRDAISDEFVFAEAPLQSYNGQSVSKLLFQARYMLAMSKTSYEGKDLSDFGLDEKSKPIKITVTDRSGKTDTVLFGNLSVTGGAYYMKHTEKPFIYLMDSTASVFENSLTSYISPILAKSIPENESGYIESFSILKNGEKFFECRIIPEEKREGTSSTDLHKSTYPANYSPSMTNFYGALSSVASLSGESVVEVNVSKKENKDDIFKFYGLDKPANEVSWSYKGENSSFITSVLCENSYYYAYSSYMDTIVVLPRDNAPFLEYGLIDFVDEYAFRSNISNITAITVSAGRKTCRYELEHTEEKTEQNGKEKVVKNLIVKEKYTGKTIDTPSFRQFYISLMNLRIGGYSDIKSAEGLDRELSVTIETKFGEKYTYEFYTLTTTRCLMMLSGTGEFYADRNLVSTVIERNSMLMEGKTISAEY